MRPIEINLTRNESATINTAINRSNFNVSTSPGTGTGQDFIVVNYNPDNQYIVVGSVITGTYQNGNPFTANVTRIQKEVLDNFWRIYVDITLADNILGNQTMNVVNTTNSGSAGGSIIQLANLTGLEVGDHISGDAALPPNATVQEIIPAYNAIRVNSRLLDNIATGTTLDFNPAQQDHHIEIVPVDQYISPQEIHWEAIGGTVTVDGLLGPMTDYVTAQALTAPVTNGAYSALRFTNTSTTEESRVYIVQTGRP